MMNALTFLVLFGSALSAYALPSTHIVGGNDAPDGKYPYQVSLRQSGRHFCGGSIIDERHILSAAHCLVNLRPSAVTVHAGTNLLSETGETYAVEKVTCHKQYNSLLLINDIGVLRLSEDIKFNDKVQPIPLATTDVEEGSDCVVSGWGTTVLGGNPPNKLQELDLLVEPQKKCAAKHWRVKDSHICTYTMHGQGLCHGDSGGPLVAQGKQIGIVSFGQPCARGYPDVFTRVSSFQNWLKENTQQ